jgi:hypothetical protein
MIGPDAEIQRFGGASGHTFFDCQRFMVHANMVYPNRMNERLREVRAASTSGGNGTADMIGMMPPKLPPETSSRGGPRLLSV